VEKEHPNRKRVNRLIHEKSPYLIQHAHNPVDWYPWGQEAFDKAIAEDKPIFVSIGYSSCHWCHVMEKESFEDSEVAFLMNLAFVCVKVDREERPDIDATYMSVCQAMGRNCGWPLNVLLTPSKKPFFAASYIPKNNRFGAVGMLDLIPQIMEIWRTRRADIELTGDKVLSRIKASEQRIPGENIGKEVLDDAYEKLVMDFDDERGGFGAAPKFPRPHSLLFLLRYCKRTGEKNALAMVEKTLQQMRLGGMFDQIGFGFHRYKKMLYDQALALWVYALAYKVLGDFVYRDAALGVVRCLHDSFARDGFFMTALDADTAHVEGATYVWNDAELHSLLNTSDYAELARTYDVSAQGNFEGNIHLVRLNDNSIAKIERLLLDIRRNRVQPEADDKILAGQNALLAMSLLFASRYLPANDLDVEGKELLRRVLERFWDGKRMAHAWAKGILLEQEFLFDVASVLCAVTVASEDDESWSLLWDPLETSVRSFHVNGVWLESREADFLPILAQRFDQPVPSAVALAELALARLALLRGEVPGELANGDAFSQDFSHLGAMLTQGDFHCFKGPRPLAWKDLPANAMQIRAADSSDCYRGVCRPLKG